MTRSDLMAIVTEIVESSGRPYVTSTAGQNGIANSRMAQFSAETECLWSDNIALTLVTNQAIYNTRSLVATPSAMARVHSVTIDGYALNKAGTDQPGMTPITDLERNRGYLATPAGKPVMAAQMDPGTFRLWPKPDQVYSNCYVSGPVLQPAIDTTSAGDDTALSFLDEDCRAVAVFVAIGLIAWGAGSESDYQRMQYLDGIAANHMRELTARSYRRRASGTVRGSRGARQVGLNG